MSRLILTALVSLILPLNAWSADPDPCTEQIHIARLKEILKTDNPESQNSTVRNAYEWSLPLIVQCPSDYTHHPQLSSREQENLKKILIRTQLSRYAVYIADNMPHLDLASEIAQYKKIHEAVYGKNKAYDPDMQSLIKNSALFLADQKKMCSEVSVDTSSMGPVRDQQDTAWCYAYAVADLLSFHSKQTLSAVDVAILHNNYAPGSLKKRMDIQALIRQTENPIYNELFDQMNITKSDLLLQNSDGAFDNTESTADALRVALKKGVCLEKDLPSSSEGNLSLDSKRQAALLYKNFGFDSDSACVDRLGGAQKLFQNMQIKQIESVINATDSTHLLLSLRNANCKNTIRLSNKKIVTSAPTSTYRNMFNILDRQLDKKQPIVIDYESGLIDPSLPGSHTSIVVGRRYNSQTNRCEYQIRNSWGKNVDFSPSAVVKHKDGLFWVDDQHLKNYMFNANALD